MALRRADIDEMLHHHGFVAGCGPHEGGTKARKLGDALQDVRALHGIDHGIRQGGEGVIRGSQQDAAQPDNIAGDGKRDDLAATIGQQLITASPASL